MATRAVEYIDLPIPSPGTRRSLKIIRYGKPGARPRAYLQTGLHADENPGMLVLKYLDELIGRADANHQVLGEIVLVPVANPIGLGQHVHSRLLGRFEFDSGQNFNRHYPDLVDDIAATVAGKLGDGANANVALIREAMRARVRDLPAMSELDSLRKTLMSLACDADICLDLHCDGEAVLYMFTGESLWPAATDLAAQLGCRVTLLADSSGGNAFDEAVGGVWWALADRFPDRSIPPACLSATIELRGRADVDAGLAASDARNLLAFLTRRGVLAGDPGPLPDLPAPATPFTGVDEVRAPVAGLVVYQKSPGDTVRAGEVVARVVDPLSESPVGQGVPLVSRTRGILYARRGDRFTLPGQPLCHIAGDVPLPDRIPGKLMSD